VAGVASTASLLLESSILLASSVAAIRRIVECNLATSRLALEDDQPCGADLITYAMTSFLFQLRLVPTTTTTTRTMSVLDGTYAMTSSLVVHVLLPQHFDVRHDRNSVTTATL
jgi:hypothetical protein